jgi:DNA-binding XRE family transcriptional regulator
MSEIGDYLNRELRRLDWNQADLARNANVSRTTISDVISGKHQPGIKLCNSLADALGVPVETLFRAAGLLPDLPTPRDQFEEILSHRLSLLTDAQLEDVLKYIEFISTKEQKPIKVKTKQNREGERPPETVK